MLLDTGLGIGISSRNGLIWLKLVQGVLMGISCRIGYRIEYGY